MHTALLLCLLVPFAIALEDGVIELPIQHHSIHKDVFVKAQTARLASLGRGARQMPKYHQKLLEAPFKNDYLTAKVSFGTPPQVTLDVPTISLSGLHCHTEQRLDTCLGSELKLPSIKQDTTRLLFQVSLLTLLLSVSTETRRLPA
jgi:hypothetical protein